MSIGLFDSGIFISRIFKLYDNQGKAINKQNNIRPLGFVVALYRELVADNKFVIIDIIEINKPDLIAPYSVFAKEFNLNTFCKQAMKFFIVVYKVLAG